ncbi:16S rRNA (cytidine(1402)-2'-O)-methyltransferase [Spirochaetota bacterium]
MIKQFYIISTPIGNLEDISERAKSALAGSDAIFVEEYRKGKKTLDLLKIDISEKDIITFNEHDEKKFRDSFIIPLVEKYKTASLISDCGTPLIADPGSKLLDLLLKFRIPITHIPGPSSVISALVLSGFSTKRFYYAGFLSPKREGRIADLKRIAGMKSTIVIMETPYRLLQLIESIKKVFGPGRDMALCFNMTKKNEYIFRGTVQDAWQYFSNKKVKEEFVIVLDNNDLKSRYSRK